MKSIVIIGAWCNTKEKEECLIDSIRAARKEGKDVLVFSRLPLREDIQKMTDYYLYDSSNPLINKGAFIWTIIGNRKIYRSIGIDYGFAAMEQIVKSIGFVRSLRYDIAYWINYDIDTTHFDRFINECDTFLIDNDLYVFPWYSDPLGLDMTAMGININSSHELMRMYITLEDYKKNYEEDEKLISESNFFKLIRESKLKYHINDEISYMGGKISTEGVRINGRLPSESKISKWAEIVFIGSSYGKYIISILGIKERIDQIILNTGKDDIAISVNASTNAIEFPIDKPTRLEIISINLEIINEILDDVIDNNYLNSNFLEHI